MLENGDGTGRNYVAMGGACVTEKKTFWPNGQENCCGPGEEGNFKGNTIGNVEGLDLGARKEDVKDRQKLKGLTCIGDPSNGNNSSRRRRRRSRSDNSVAVVVTATSTQL